MHVLYNTVSEKPTSAEAVGVDRFRFHGMEPAMACNGRPEVLTKALHNT